MNWIEDFWSDGNWGARQAERDAEYEKRYAKKQKDEMERIRKEFLEREIIERYEAAKKEAFSKFGEGKWHGGPCCSQCAYEWTNDFYCCCNDGAFPLENKDYKPEHPPLHGMPPDVFYKWGRKTQERYVKRFDKELAVDIHFLENGLGTITIPRDHPGYTVSIYSKGTKMAEKVNGWTISSRDNYGTQMWQAVNKEGVIGMAKEDKGTVVRFAQSTKAEGYGKR